MFFEIIAIYILSVILTFIELLIANYFAAKFHKVTYLEALKGLFKVLAEFGYLTFLILFGPIGTVIIGIVLIYAIITDFRNNKYG